MSTPIQFASQDAFETAIADYLRANLQFDVSSDIEVVDTSYGNYQERRTHRVEVLLGSQKVTSFTLD